MNASIPQKGAEYIYAPRRKRSLLDSLTNWVGFWGSGRGGNVGRSIQGRSVRRIYGGTRGRNINVPIAFYDGVPLAIVKRACRATDDRRQSAAVPTSGILPCGCWRPRSGRTRKQTTVWSGRGSRKHGIVGLGAVVVAIVTIIVGR